MAQNAKENQFVTVVTRFGQVMGVYANTADACQVISELVAKGQTAEMCIKSLL